MTELTYDTNTSIRVQRNQDLIEALALAEKATAQNVELAKRVVELERDNERLREQRYCASAQVAELLRVKEDVEAALTELIDKARQWGNPHYVRGVEAALGSGIKETLAVESELRSFSRRALFTTRDVAAGEELGPHNVAALRTGKLPQGLPPEAIDRVTGRKAVRDLPAESPIEDADLA